VRTFTRGARGSQVGTLPLPRSTGQGGALDVALSSDNKYAFMAPVHGDTIAVFNLAKALSSGHLSISDLVGNVQLGSQPTAMALSPDGNWLYVTSSPGGRANAVGQLTVLNAHTAEVTPLASVVRTVTAGCYPGGVTTSADGNVVWVSARDSDDLLASSAAKLQADPKHSLIAAGSAGSRWACSSLRAVTGWWWPTATSVTLRPRVTCPC
jgi:DNA-binding beta-propeller fold protein YncE